MIEVFKYMNGFYDVEKPEFKLATTTHLRGHPQKLQKQQFKKRLRSNFFTNRINSTWNSLPEAVIPASTVNTFKNRLDAHWKNLLLSH